MAFKSKQVYLNIASLFIIGIFASPSVVAAPVTVNYNNLHVYAFDDTDETLSNYHVTYAGTGIPATQTLNAVSGASSNTTEINYAGDADSAIFSTNILHNINNTGGLDVDECCDHAKTNLIQMEFTVNTNSSYSISGFYDITGLAESKFLVGLADITDSILLFRENSVSRNTVDESHNLGDVTDGDFANELDGLLTGNLIAGHDYVLSFDSFINAHDGLNEYESIASASGNVTLSITAVPLPAAVWLFGSGLIGLIGVARRKKA